MQDIERITNIIRTMTTNVEIIDKEIRLGNPIRTIWTVTQI